MLDGLNKDSSLDELEKAIRIELHAIGGRKNKIALAKLKVSLKTRIREIGFPRGSAELVTAILGVKPKKTNNIEFRGILQPTPPNKEKNGAKVGSDIPGAGHSTPEFHNVDSKGLSLESLKLTIGQSILLPDPDAIETVLALAASHNLHETPVWLWIIAPPSSGKTENVDLLNLHPRVHTISSLTSKTLFSGLSAEDSHDGEAPALMSKLKDNILTFKDFTTVLNLRKDDRDLIFSDLREIFDGEYRKNVGTGERILWEGHISFLAGVTAVIDRYHSVMGDMGPRFLSFRLQLPKEKDAMRLSRNRPKGHEWKQKKRFIQEQVWQFLRDLPMINPTFDDYAYEMVENIAMFVSRSRSRAYFSSDGDLEEVPEHELSMRLNQQLQTLAKGYAMIRKSEKIEKEDLVRILRVGFDTLPPGRRMVIEKLWKQNGLSNSQLMGGTTYGEDLLGRNTSALYALNAITFTGGVGQSGKSWSLSKELGEIMEPLKSLLPTT